MLPATYCLGGRLFRAAAATTESDISRMGVAVAGGINVVVVVSATVLHISLVRSTTRFWSGTLSSQSRLITLFVSSSWILIKVIILADNRVSIF